MQPSAAEGAGVERVKLDWAKSKSVGGVTEIAVLAPIKLGRIPGERRTYEERVRSVIDLLQRQAARGLPIELARITTIHFGRMTIIRPEQYLVYSDLGDALEYHANEDTADERTIPKPIDDYEPPTSAGVQPPGAFRSWLLTQVTFDGDLKVYFRDIAEFINTMFDFVFRNCEDFPSTLDFEEFWRWVRRYQVSTDLFYPAYRNVSVVRLRYLEEFKRRFDEFVAQVRTPTGRKVARMDDLFDAFLRGNQQFGKDFPAPGGTYPKNID